MPKPRQKPAYCRHRPTNQAYCRVKGRMIYLGEWDTPASHARFGEELEAWSLGQNPVARHLTVDKLALKYLAHAREYYCHPDGSPTGAAETVRLALRYVVGPFGSVRASEFGPLKLKEARDAMIAAGRVRTNINRMVHIVRGMFRWGLENELVPPSVVESLRAVAPLKAGRSKAKEAPPVKPVPEADVLATLPHLPRVVQAMVRLQLLTGSRPGEICAMTPGEITLGTDGTWTYRPSSHKTAWRGKERRIFIGPQGQEILRPFLDRPADQRCFRPCDSEAERNAQRKAARRSPTTPSQRARAERANTNRKRPPGEFYSKDGYVKVITRACKLAGVEQWSPNRLRHSRATLLRKLFGLEAARLVLGHADAGITLTYAERDFDAAAKIQAEIG